MADAPKYRVTDKLDAGGMAEVYRGVAESTVGGVKRAVAIKKILPNLTKNKKFVQMFLDEARITAQLRHPNVCDVLEFGEADGGYFIAMEYLHGETLGAALKRCAPVGGLPFEIAARIVADAARGLHAAHELTRSDGSPSAGSTCTSNFPGAPPRPRSPRVWWTRSSR